MHSYIRTFFLQFYKFLFIFYRYDTQYLFYNLQIIRSEKKKEKLNYNSKTVRHIVSKDFHVSTFLSTWTILTITVLNI